jgi:DNA mismatch endonuclease (patch repair protein)
MRGNRRRDTALEMVVRRALHAKGLRYRVDYAPLPGLRSRADIVFARARVAIYLDGCFWHGCPQHGTTPVANAEYWVPKLQRNRERDAATTQTLCDNGWIVLRFWEHEHPSAVVERITSTVRSVMARADVTG